MIKAGQLGRFAKGLAGCGDHDSAVAAIGGDKDLEHGLADLFDRARINRERGWA